MDNYETFYTDGKGSDDEAADICSLKYRNFNVFSPGAGITGLIEDGFKELNKLVVGGIDLAFDALDHEMDNVSGQVKNQINQALHNISEELQGQLEDHLALAIGDEQSLSSPLKRYKVVDDLDVTSAINNVLKDYSGDAAFIHDLNDSTIQNNIIKELQGQIQTMGFTTSVEETLMDAIRTQVDNAFEKTINQAMDTLQTTLTNEFNTISTKLETKITHAISTKISSIIPSGLPLIPPTWIATLNVWYIEIDGNIPRFTLVDTTDETKADTLFGHTAQIYHRRNKEIKVDTDGDGTEETDLGSNKAVGFNCVTGTFIIVPNGGTGIGDRSGGWDETIEFPQP